MARPPPQVDPLDAVFARLNVAAPEPLVDESARTALNQEVTSPIATRIQNSLNAAVAALVDRLVKPLLPVYPASKVDAVRNDLIAALVKRFRPSWRLEDPLHGTGFRSLICAPKIGIPQPMQAVARKHGVDPTVWLRALSARTRGDDSTLHEEWQAWCDPGVVTWRYGGWHYDDPELDPVKAYREPVQTVWTAPQAQSADNTTATPPRANRAIPIRAPQLFAIPPTPATDGAATGKIPASTVPSFLLPSANIAVPSPLRPGSTGSPLAKGANAEGPGDSQAKHAVVLGGHRGSDSQSSMESIAPDAQLLTPGTRPGSTNPFQDDSAGSAQRGGKVDETPIIQTRGRDPSPNTPRYPTPGSGNGTPTAAHQTTPYDNGNVIVIGGGVKLGGSRPASVASSNRRAGERDRSPSISIASRALNSVMSNGSRKTRSRRRIMPSYLGHLGQPGVGGPISGAFAPGQPGTPSGQPGATQMHNPQPGQPAQILPLTQGAYIGPNGQYVLGGAPGQPGQSAVPFSNPPYPGSVLVQTPAGPIWMASNPFGAAYTARPQ